MSTHDAQEIRDYLNALDDELDAPFEIDECDDGSFIVSSPFMIISLDMEEEDDGFSINLNPELPIDLIVWYANKLGAKFPNLVKYESYYCSETTEGVIFGDEAYELRDSKFVTMN